MTKGEAYEFDRDARSRILVPEHDELDNGSVTDTLQWCELHQGHCPDVVPVRRVFENPCRRDELFFACQKCIRDLKKAGLMEESKYAGLPCAEVTVPKGLSQRRTSPYWSPTISPLRSRQVAYEVTLEVLQVKHLRALGLTVIPA